MIFSWISNKRNKEYFFYKKNKDLVKELKFLGISDDNILNSIRNIPRELFIDQSLIKKAYENIPLPIKCGQTISQPYVVAYMISCLKLKKTDSILEVGTGTGYQTALLSHLCKKVYTIELLSELLNQAKKNIAILNLKNITFKLDNGIKGLEDKYLFDAIIISASSETIPTKLLKNLKSGGHLIMPKKYPMGKQKLILVKKNEEDHSVRELFDVKFVSLLNKNAE